MADASPIPDEIRRANLAHWDEWTRIHEDRKSVV